MSEKSRTETAALVFKGVATVAGGVAIATGHADVGMIAGFSAWSADVVQLAQGEYFDGARTFVNGLFGAHVADGYDAGELKQKLESKPGVKTTVAAIRTLFELIDESAEPALRRLALDYVVVGQKPDAFFRGVATMLTHCDATDIRDLQSVFGMMIGEHEGEMRVASGVSNTANFDGHRLIEVGRSNATIGILSEPGRGGPLPTSFVTKSVAVTDAERVMRLMDDHRVTRPRAMSAITSKVTAGIIAKDHVSALVRAFSQT